MKYPAFILFIITPCTAYAQFYRRPIESNFEAVIMSIFLLITVGVLLHTAYNRRKVLFETTSGKVQNIRIIENAKSYISEKSESVGTTASYYEGSTLCLFRLNEEEYECCLDSIFFEEGDFIECTFKELYCEVNRKALYAIRKPDTREQWVDFYSRSGGSRVLWRTLKGSLIFTKYSAPIIFIFMLVFDYFLSEYDFNIYDALQKCLIMTAMLFVMVNTLLFLILYKSSREDVKLLALLGYKNPKKINLNKCDSHYY